MGPYIRLTTLGIEEVDNALLIAEKPTFIDKIKALLINPWVVKVGDGIILLGYTLDSPPYYI
jgi:hypothetical protein